MTEETLIKIIFVLGMTVSIILMTIESVYLKIKNHLNSCYYVDRYKFEKIEKLKNKNKKVA